MKKRLLSMCPIADETAKKRIAEYYDITELKTVRFRNYGNTETGAETACL